jgi:UDP-glucose 4-epimerase
VSRSAYLVTGGCGFIGSHLCEELVRLGHTVRILDNLSSGYLRNIDHLKGRVEFLQGDIRSRGDLARAAEGVDYIFHEAALVSVFDSVERPADNNDINITGTLNVLLAAKDRGVRRVVMASSAAVYGNDPELPKRETMRPQPESPYAIGKITGEHYLRVFSSLYGVEAVSLRYFNVFGPRQDPKSFYSGVISKFADDVTAGRQPTVFGDGLQSRDFVFVKDVVRANLLAMHAGNAGKGEAFNIGTAHSSTLLDLIGILGDLAGRPVAPTFRPARAGDIRHSLADISSARKDLGYEPAFDLKSGLRELLDSLKSNNAECRMPSAE